MADDRKPEGPEAGKSEKADAPVGKARKGGKAKRKRRLTLPFRIFLTLLILAGLTAGVSYLLYRQWLTDPENIRELAVSKLSILFPDKDVEVGSASFELFEGLDLYGVAVKDPVSEVSVAKFDHMHIDFDLGGFMRLALLPKSITVSGLFIDLVRTQEGDWNLALPAAGGEAPKGRRLAAPFSVRIEAAFVSVDDRFTDYSLSFPIDSATFVSGDDSISQWRLTTIFGGGQLGNWRVSVFGDAAEETVEMEFAVAAIEMGALEKRMPPSARRIYGIFRPKGSADLTGSARRKGESGWTFKTAAHLRGCEATYINFPLTATELTGVVNFTEKGYRLESLECLASGGTVTLSGGGTYGRDAHVDITAVCEDVTAGEAFIDAIGGRAEEAVRRFNPRGRIDTTVRVEREAGPGKPVRVSADTTLKGITARYDVFPMPLENVSGRVVFADRNVQLRDIRASHGEADILINGLIEKVGPDGSTDVLVLAKDLALDEELRVLLPARAQAAWRALAVTGMSDIEVAIAARPSEGVRLDITAALRGMSVLYDKVPYPLSGGEGMLRVGEGKAVFEGMRFYNKGAGVTASGVVDMETGDTQVRLSVTDMPIEDEVTAAMPPNIAGAIDLLGLSGTVDAEFDVRGGADGKYEMGDTVLHIRDAQFLAPRLPLGFGDAEATAVCTGEYIEIKSLEGYVFGDNLAELLPVLRLARAGLPAGEAEVSGRVPIEARKNDWEMSFRTRRLVVDTAFLNDLGDDIEEAFADKNLHGYGDVSGEVKMSESEGEPSAVFDLSVDSREFNITLTRPIADVVGEMSFKGGWAGESTTFDVMGELAAAVLDRRAFGHTSFSLEKTKEQARLETFRTEVAGGTIEGQGRLDLTGGGKHGFSARIRGMDLAKLLEKTLGYRDEDLGGKVAGTLDVLAHSSDSNDVVAAGEATIEKGKLWEVPLVLAIMNVLNLKMPDRVQFDSATVRYKLTERRILVEEFSMSSDPATIYGKGTIYLDGTLDLTFYSQPGRIPIISLIAGRVGRNLIRASVTGTFEDPKVNIIPGAAMGRAAQWVRRPFRKEGK